MGALLGALRALLHIAGALADFFSRKQMLDAGAAKAQAEGLESGIAAVRRAQEAKDAVADSSDGDVRRRLHERWTRPE